MTLWFFFSFWKEKELKKLNKKKTTLMNRLEGKPDEEEDSDEESNKPFIF